VPEMTSSSLSGRL